MINVPAIFSKSTAMTGPEANRNIIAVGAVVPRDVEDGILALPVAFPAHRAQDEGERNLAARLRLEAFEGFEVFIAVFVLKRCVCAIRDTPSRPMARIFSIWLGKRETYCSEPSQTRA